MDFIELKTNVRTAVGNGPARALRREGRVPAVLYGPDTEPIMLSVSVSDMENVFKQGSAGQMLLKLLIQNGETSSRSAMIKEVQLHPVSRNLLHIDFYEIAMDRKIRVKVPVVATGKSKGVEDGGILQIIRREIEVYCFPNKVPETIEIDITDLEIGDSIHVGEIPAEEDVEWIDEAHFTVVTVLSPKIEEVEEEVEEVDELEAAEAGEAGAEPEASESEEDE